jgi:hypothetical protein
MTLEIVNQYLSEKEIAVISFLSYRIESQIRIPLISLGRHNSKAFPRENQVGIRQAWNPES